MMANKTKSNVPKTPTQKKRWIRARQITAKESGKYTDKNLPWPLVQTIYKNEEEAGKTAKKSDVTKAKKSKAVSKYKN